MATIQYLSRSIVQAFRPDIAAVSSKRLELTPWDLQLLLISPIQKGLVFNKPNLQQGEDKIDIINRLKASLSRTLDVFPPVAGRLAAVDHGDDTTSFFLDCNNKGVLFVHAVADGVTVSDVVKPGYVPKIVHSFFPLDGIQNIEATTEPILGVQVTELNDGIFIGLAGNHAVCDGTTFWHFFKSWAENSRGSSVSKSPVFQHCFDGIEFPIRIPNSLIKQNHGQFVPTPFKERIFHFSKENIAKLKARANADMGTDKISSLQALLCHLWRSVCRVKHVDPDADTRFGLTIGCRPRIQSIPEGYFGPAIQVTSLTLKAKELADEHGLGKAAWEMNKTVNSHTKEKLIDYLESWSKSPNILPQASLPKNAYMISSSPIFNPYGYDFGWGKPLAIRSGGGNKSDGKITVSSGSEEGSVDLEVCFSPEILEALGNDEEFITAETI